MRSAETADCERPADNGGFLMCNLMCKMRMQSRDRNSAIYSAAVALLWIFLGPSAEISRAQTIQLPAFQQRGVRTTVVIPDRGSISLGGVSGARQSRVRIAPPFLGPLAPTRAFRSSRGIGNMQIRVWVHDLQAMDAAILADGLPTVANGSINSQPRTLTRRKPRPMDRIPAGN